LELPGFHEDGLLPPGDYEMTFDELKASMLVHGPDDEECLQWDSEWRMKLVENLEIMVGQLWEVRITEIFVNGSFAEDKDHPNDIDGYFECSVYDIATGQLERSLNKLDLHKVWTWAPESRKPYRNQPKKQLPMWHRYRVELYPHYYDVPLELQSTGIQDEFGNDLPFPAAFRKSRREHKPKGIIKIKR
jgi:hypothetical protein